MLGRYDQSKAIAAIETLKLSGNNLVLAHYWLSLWHDGAPPARGQINPARIKDLLPGISIVDVGENAVVRLSGSALDTACRRPMRGLNLLDFVSGKGRELRSARLRAVVDGSVTLSRLGRSSEPKPVIETVRLPFFGQAEDGTRSFITHTSWRPDPDWVHDPHARYDMGFPDEYQAVSFA